MAGSINLSLSQQFDKTTGALLSGGKLQFYQAGTLTPQSAYKDTGLTLPHPNPITLATDGRVPALYIADGQIRVRLLNSVGVVQFDQDNLLVVGPSSGSGGGGSSVDATAIFTTGDVLWQEVQGTRTGWVRDNGRTIGSASSGATERANADTQPLFEYLWNTFSDTFCPVLTGRGVSSSADWSANKQITLRDKRNYIPGGLDDMGNSAKGGFTGVPVVSGSVTTAGSVIGETAHAQLEAEMFAHAHGGVTGTHVHAIHGSQITTAATGGTRAVPITASDTSGALWAGGGATNFGNTDTTTATIASQGSGTAANITQLTVLGTFFRKL